jgi:hypothetical protein
MSNQNRKIDAKSLIERESISAPKLTSQALPLATDATDIQKKLAEERQAKKARLQDEMVALSNEDKLLDRNLAMISGAETLTKFVHEGSLIVGQGVATVLGGPTGGAAFRTGVGLVSHLGQAGVQVALGEDSTTIKEQLRAAASSDVVEGFFSLVGGKAAQGAAQAIGAMVGKNLSTVATRLVTGEIAGLTSTTVQNLREMGEKIANGETITRQDITHYGINYVASILSAGIGSRASTGNLGLGHVVEAGLNTGIAAGQQYLEQGTVTLDSTLTSALANATQGYAQARYATEKAARGALPPSPRKEGAPILAEGDDATVKSGSSVTGSTVPGSQQHNIINVPQQNPPPLLANATRMFSALNTMHTTTAGDRLGRDKAQEILAYKVFAHDDNGLQNKTCANIESLFLSAGIPLSSNLRENLLTSERMYSGPNRLEGGSFARATGRILLNVASARIGDRVDASRSPFSHEFLVTKDPAQIPPGLNVLDTFIPSTTTERLLVDLLKGAVLRPDRDGIPAFNYERKRKWLNCKDSEFYMSVTLGGTDLRRDSYARVAVYCNETGQPVIYQKRGDYGIKHNDDHSNLTAITLKPILVNGMLLPPGTLIGLESSQDSINQDTTRDHVLPISCITGVIPLRLTVFALPPSEAMSTFGLHYLDFFQSSYSRNKFVPTLETFQVWAEEVCGR